MSSGAPVDGSPHGRGVEVVDVDGHAALATEDDDLVVENEVLGAHDPAGRMQRLMEVVRADRRVGLGPQLLDEDITMNPMARRERQQLDDRLRLAQPPRWRRDGALDAHREPAQEGDPHGPSARRSPTHAPCSPPHGQPVARSEQRPPDDYRPASELRRGQRNLDRRRDPEPRPAYLDRDATVEVVTAEIRASRHGGRGEWSCFRRRSFPAIRTGCGGPRHGRTPPGTDVSHARQAVDIPGPVTASPGAAARGAGLGQSLSPSARRSGTLYNSLSTSIRSRLSPGTSQAGPDRWGTDVWGSGDGPPSTVVDTGRRSRWVDLLGELMPLARAAMYEQA